MEQKGFNDIHKCVYMYRDVWYAFCGWTSEQWLAHDILFYYTVVFKGSTLYQCVCVRIFVCAVVVVVVICCFFFFSFFFCFSHFVFSECTVLRLPFLFALAKYTKSVLYMAYTKRASERERKRVVRMARLWVCMVFFGLLYVSETGDDSRRARERMKKKSSPFRFHLHYYHRYTEITPDVSRESRKMVQQHIDLSLRIFAPSLSLSRLSPFNDMLCF